MQKLALDISGLDVTVEKKHIIKNLNLQIQKGEVHILFGPNGSGKSTLLSAIMGLPGYRIRAGSILFNGTHLEGKKPDTIAQSGIALSFQHPPTVHGVSLETFLRKINRSKDLDTQLHALNLQNLLPRDLNSGFSGGELKRAEIAKLYAQNPQLVLIDEPESGVDLENIALIAEAINAILTAQSDRSALIITHTGYILDYIQADRGHIMIGGEIVHSAKPDAIMRSIKYQGFSPYERSPHDSGP